MAVSHNVNDPLIRKWLGAVEGKGLSLCPNSQVALKVNYSAQEMMYACEIVFLLI